MAHHLTDTQASYPDGRASQQGHQLGKTIARIKRHTQDQVTGLGLFCTDFFACFELIWSCCCLLSTCLVKLSTIHVLADILYDHMANAAGVYLAKHAQVLTCILQAV
jgi:hypothetical protein